MGGSGGPFTAADARAVAKYIANTPEFDTLTYRMKWEPFEAMVSTFALQRLRVTYWRTAVPAALMESMGRILPQKRKRRVFHSIYVASFLISSNLNVQK